MVTKPHAVWPRMALGSTAGGAVLFLVRLAFGTSLGLSAAVGAATAAALFVGLFLLYWFTKSLPRPGTVVTALVEGGMSREATLDAASEALSGLGVRHLRRHNDTVRGVTGMSAKSFGETIQVSLVGTGADKIGVRFATAPRLRTTILDYGHSAELADRFVRELELRVPGNVRILRDPSFGSA